MKNNLFLFKIVRNILLIAASVVLFIILISFILVGLGEKGTSVSSKEKVEKFNLKSEDLVLDNKKTGENKIKVYITKEDKIEEMYIEEYVRGVVSAEMPAEFHLEALKAQAVAARTFALAHMEEYGGTKYSKAKGANVCDTVQCQVYMNKEDRLKTWPKSKGEEYYKKVTEAVQETSGKVLTYDNKLVLKPYYFATSSGKTEDAKEVLNVSIPYLKSVKSSGEEIAPKYKTSLKLSYKNFVNTINNKANAKVTTNNVKSKVKIKERSSSGSVKWITLGGATISGSNFRSLFNLSSSNFDIVFEKKEVIINCKGYGHGLGMSQWGANVRAKEGKKYDEILKHYYSGVNIEDIEKLIIK